MKANATAAQVDALNFFHDFTSFASGGQVYAMHPGVPSATQAAVRSAFAKVIESQQFKDDFAKQGVDAGLLSGEDLQALVERSSKLSPEVLAVLTRLFSSQ